MPDYDARRPRIDVELAARLDAERGDIPFERFVRRLLHNALAEYEPMRVERRPVEGPAQKFNRVQSLRR